MVMITGCISLDNLMFTNMPDVINMSSSLELLLSHERSGVVYTTDSPVGLHLSFFNLVQCPPSILTLVLHVPEHSGHSIYMHVVGPGMTWEIMSV